MDRMRRNETVGNDKANLKNKLLKIALEKNNSSSSSKLKHTHNNTIVSKESMKKGSKKLSKGNTQVDTAAAATAAEK